jgi:hypothetical protein
MGARYQKNPPAQTLSKLRITNAGALDSILDQSGGELLGGGNHAMREGYVFRYQTKQGERLVYAVGKQTSGLTYPKTMPATGVMATAIAKTADGVLEISSGYKLDVRKNQLSIIRKIRNVSTESVTLSLVQNYVDPRLFSDQETRIPPMQPSFDVKVGPGPVGFLPGQVGYSGTLNRIRDDFLDQVKGDLGLPLGGPECSCPTPPPCPACLRAADLVEVCDLCQQVAGSDEKICCGRTSSESPRPQAQIYSTRVGRSVYYDAVVGFLPETAVLTLHPPSKSTQESKKSQAYVITEIQLRYK